MFRLLLLGIFLLQAGPGTAYAEGGRLRVWFLMSDAGGAYAEVAHAAQQGLPPSVTSKNVQLGTDMGWTNAIAPDDLVIPLGLKAAKAMSRIEQPAPVLAALLPRQGYEAVVDAAPSDAAIRSYSALVLDQPLERQLALIRLALSGVDTVGVLLGQSTANQMAELTRLARLSDMRLNAQIVESAGEIFASQRDLLRDSDVLLAIPDPLVINQTTLVSYLITAYRARVPVIGFSQSFADAGALAAVYSTPEQIGRQLAEIITDIAVGKSLRAGRVIYPRYFKVYVNRQVARSLELNIAPDERLQRQLELKSGGGL